MNKYDLVIEAVFFKNYKPGDVRVAFNREELADASVRSTKHQKN